MANVKVWSYTVHMSTEPGKHYAAQRRTSQVMHRLDYSLASSSSLLHLVLLDILWLLVSKLSLLICKV